MIIGRLAVKLMADVGSFIADMDESQKKIEKISKGATDAGKVLTAGLTAPIVGAGAAVLGMINSASEMADKMLILSDRTGLSTDLLQELNYIAEQTGTSIEGLSIGASTLTRNLVAGAEGNEAVTKTMKGLGISITDSSGALKTQEALFYETLTALAEVKDETLQSAMAQQLFGRAGKELLPTLRLGAAGIAGMQKTAHDLGVVLGRDALVGLDAYGDKLTDVKQALKSMAFQLGEGLLPVLNSFVSFADSTLIPAIRKTADFLGAMGRWFAALPGPVQTATFVVAGLAAAIGPLLLAFGGILAAVPTLVSGFTAIKTGMALVSLFAKGSLIPAIAPILIPLAAIAAALIAGAIVWNVWGDDIKKAVMPALNWAYEKLYEFGGWLGKTFPKFFQGVGDTVKPIVRATTDSVVKSNEQVAGSYNDMTQKILNESMPKYLFANDNIKKSNEQVQLSLIELGKYLKPPERTVYDAINEDSAKTAEAILQVQEKVLILDTSILNLGDTSKQTGQTASQAFSFVRVSMIEAFTAGVSGSIGKIKSLAQYAQDAGKTIGNIFNPLNIIGGFAEAIFNPGKGGYGYLFKHQKELQNRLKEAYKTAGLSKEMEKSIMKKGKDDLFKGFSVDQILKNRLAPEVAKSQIDKILKNVFNRGDIGEQTQKDIRDIVKNQLSSGNYNVDDILNAAFNEALAPRGVFVSGEDSTFNLDLTINGSVGVDDIAQKIVEQIRQKLGNAA